ncbi:MAG TPA: hypothetical protein VFV49_13190 [Thermoanaerobaculia bacterium]|nr:hypothetical protein [Thermoanaerobaculia bacterium]
MKRFSLRLHYRQREGKLMIAFTARRWYVLSFLLCAPLLQAQVTFDAVITASGEETVGHSKKNVDGTFPYFEVRGSALGGRPSKTVTVTTCVSKEDLAVCTIDKSATGGYTIYVDQINSPGGGLNTSYSLNEATGCLTSTVTVKAKRLQRGFYSGRHVIHLACPIKQPWSNTVQTGPFMLGSTPTAYTYLADYNGPIGSPAAIAGTATVHANDNGYKVQLVNKSPANAILTSGMFESTPAAGGNGPHLWVLYDANDITARALEISQGVQNLHNDMPLVAGRRTMARFYVQSKHAAGNVAAQLKAFRNGMELPGSPLAAESTLGVRPSGIDRTKLDHAFLFKLPQGWTAAGDVQFEATVNPGGLVDEVQSGDNLWTAPVRFQVANDAYNTIVAVPLHLHENGDRTRPLRIYETTDATFTPISQHLMRMHPIAGAIPYDCGLDPLEPAGHGFPLFREWDLADSSHWDLMVGRIIWKKFWSDCGPAPSYWVGMIDPNLPGKQFGGNANPFGKTSVVRMTYFTHKDRPWYLSGGSSFAHEIGHNKTLDHVCKEGSPDGQDPNYPYPDPCLMSTGNKAFFGNGHDGYFMLDVYHDYWGAAQPAILGSNVPGVVTFDSDRQVKPLMSYAQYRWISPYSYCKLLDEEGIPCNRLQISARYPEAWQLLARKPVARMEHAADMMPWNPRNGSAPPPSPQRSASAPQRMRATAKAVLPEGYELPSIERDAAAYLVVEGELDLELGFIDTFSLTKLREMPTAHALADAQARREGFTAMLADPSEPAPAVLLLRQYDDAASRRLLRLDIVARLDRNGGDAGSSHRYFLHLVELAAGARYFELTDGSEELVLVDPSVFAPQVSLQPLPSTLLAADTVLRWTATDADGGALTFSVFYSADGGATWRLVDSEIEGFEYRIDDGVPAGQNPLRRFAGTKEGLFRVMAFDGFHTATDDLDTLLTVPDWEPRVTIMQPDGYRVESGRTVYLTGQASDLEDGPIPSLAVLTAAAIDGREIATNALLWTSSIDGLLGSGPEIRTRSLSVGHHRITLTAQDSAGHRASAHITLHVGDSDVPFENIAGQASASASSTYCGSGAIHCYDPARVNDGDRSTALGGFTSWSNDANTLSPHWVQLTWAGAITTDQVEVFTSEGFPIQDYDLQTWNGLVWSTVASVRDNTELHRVHSFPAIVTTQLRIVGLTGPLHQPGHVRVNEVLVYGTVAPVLAGQGR